MGSVYQVLVRAPGDPWSFLVNSALRTCYNSVTEQVVNLRTAFVENTTGCVTPTAFGKHLEEQDSNKVFRNHETADVSEFMQYIFERVAVESSVGADVISRFFEGQWTETLRHHGYGSSPGCGTENKITQKFTVLHLNID